MKGYVKPLPIRGGTYARIRDKGKRISLVILIYCKGLFHFKPEKVWIQGQRTGSSIEQNRKQDSLKEAKKAEFSKQIIFYCIFAPNYETNCTDIYISVRYRDMGGYGAKHLKPDEQSRPVR